MFYHCFFLNIHLLLSATNPLISSSPLSGGAPKSAECAPAAEPPPAHRARSPASASPCAPSAATASPSLSPSSCPISPGRRCAPSIPLDPSCRPPGWGGGASALSGSQLKGEQVPVPPRWPARCGLVRRSSEEQEEAAGGEEEEKERAGREEEQPGSALSGAGTDQAPLPVGGPQLPSPGSNGGRWEREEGGGGLQG